MEENKVIDKVAIITLLIVIIYVILLFLGIICIFYEGNIRKTNEERFYEDEEQMKFLKEYNNMRKYNENQNNLEE